MGRQILDHLPYLAARQSLRIPTGEVVEFYSYQIVVWVAVTLGNEAWEPDVNPRFPAVIDTGTNRGFYLHERHLRDWAGIPDPLTPAPSSGGPYLWHPDETPIPTWRLHGHKVWIFPNRATTHEIDSAAQPFDLGVQPVFFPEHPAIKLRNRRLALPPGPRIPALGLPAFEPRRLHLHIDAGARTVTLKE